MLNLKELNHKTVDWHKARNLIKGATDWSQSKKLLEEYTELIASQMPDASPESIKRTLHVFIDELYAGGRIKSVSLQDAPKAKLDAIGDQVVVLVNIAERNNVSLEYCWELAYNEIKDRTGTMINGSFVKDVN
jgi:hypothetical protein